MFAEALLDSSPSRAPVLKKGHYFCATACGALASLACFLALGRVFPTTPIRATAIQSLLLGGLAAAFVLMICYVYAESRQLALDTAFWVALTIVLNFAGSFASSSMQQPGRGIGSGLPFHAHISAR